MIGTCFDLLLYISYERTWYERLGISHASALELRNSILNGTMRMSTAEKHLATLGCEKVRDSIEIPAIVNNKGLLMDMDTYLKQMFEGHEKLVPYLMGRLRKSYKDCRSLWSQYLNGMSRKGKLALVESDPYASVHYEGMVLPSVWEYNTIAKVMLRGGESMADVYKRLIKCHDWEI